MDAGRGNASLGAGFERYMKAKRAADVALAATDLDWLIVRPGTLLDDPGSGRVNAGAAIGYGSVPRDDVAAFLAATVFTPFLNRVAVEVTAGDHPLAAAVARLRPRPAAL